MGGLRPLFIIALLTGLVGALTVSVPCCSTAAVRSALNSSDEVVLAAGTYTGACGFVFGGPTRNVTLRGGTNETRIQCNSSTPFVVNSTGEGRGDMITGNIVFDGLYTSTLAPAFIISRSSFTIQGAAFVSFSQTFAITDGELSAVNVTMRNISKSDSSIANATRGNVTFTGCYFADIRATSYVGSTILLWNSTFAMASSIFDNRNATYYAIYENELFYNIITGSGSRISLRGTQILGDLFPINAPPILVVTGCVVVLQDTKFIDNMGAHINAVHTSLRLTNVIQSASRLYPAITMVGGDFAANGLYATQIYSSLPPFGYAPSPTGAYLTATGLTSVSVANATFNGVKGGTMALFNVSTVTLTNVVVNGSVKAYNTGFYANNAVVIATNLTWSCFSPGVYDFSDGGYNYVNAAGLLMAEFSQVTLKAIAIADVIWRESASALRFHYCDTTLDGASATDVWSSSGPGLLYQLGGTATVRNVFLTRCGPRFTGDYLFGLWAPVNGMISALDGIMSVSNITAVDVGYPGDSLYSAAAYGVVLGASQSTMTIRNVTVLGSNSTTWTTRSPNYGGQILYSIASSITMRDVMGVDIVNGGAFYFSGGAADMMNIGLHNTTSWFQCGGIYVTNGAQLNISNVAFDGVSAGQGGSMFIDGGSVRIRNSSFTNGAAFGYEGAYMEWSGRAGSGAGVFATGNSDLDIANTTFTRNSVFGNDDCGSLDVSQLCGGGAIAVMAGATLRLENVIIADNSAPRGGGVALVGVNASLISVNFSENNAVLGGALFTQAADEAEAPRISNCTFSSNIAASGGAVYSGSQSPYYFYSTFGSECVCPLSYRGAHNVYLGNRALTSLSEASLGLYEEFQPGSGGAMVAPTVQLIGDTFIDNHADTEGGALHSVGGMVVNSTFARNWADIGGVFTAHYCGTLDVEACVIIENSARLGGVLASRNVTRFSQSIAFHSSTFTSNRAFIGGVLYLSNGHLTVNTSTFTNNSAVGPNGAGQAGVIYTPLDLADYNIPDKYGVTLLDVTMDGNYADRYGVGVWLAEERVGCTRNVNILNSRAQRDLMFVRADQCKVGFSIRSSVLGAGVLLMVQNAHVPSFIPQFGGLDHVTITDTVYDNSLCVTPTSCVGDMDRALVEVVTDAKINATSLLVANNTVEGYLLIINSANVLNLDHIVFDHNNVIGPYGGVFNLGKATVYDFRITNTFAPGNTLAWNGPDTKSTIFVNAYFGNNRFDGLGFTAGGRIDKLTFENSSILYGFSFLGGENQLSAVKNVSCLNQPTSCLLIYQPLTITNLRVENCLSTGAAKAPVIIPTDVAVTFARASIRNNSFASYAAGVQSVGTVTFTDSVFVDNAASDAAVIYSTGAATIQRSFFDGNIAGSLGAVTAYGDLSVSDTTFTNNQGSNGGAVYTSESTTVSLQRVTFSDNEGLLLGGAANIGTRHLLISGCTVQNNQAGEGGGGVYVSNMNDGSITNSQFLGNTAINGLGGGLDVVYTNLTLSITNSTFLSNTAQSHGGGLAVEAGPSSLNGVTASNNRAGSNGGGVYAAESMNMATCIINANIAGSSGGGAWICGGVISSTTIEGNSAFSDGGGLAIQETFAAAVITSSRISSNAAGSTGGGIYCGYCRGSVSSSNVSFNVGDYALMACTGDGPFTLDPGIVAAGNTNTNTAHLLLALLCANDTTVVPPKYGYVTDTCLPLLNQNCSFGCSYGSTQTEPVYRITDHVTTACDPARCEDVPSILNGILSPPPDGRTYYAHGDMIAVTCESGQGLYKYPNSLAYLYCNNSVMIFMNNNLPEGIYEDDDITCRKPSCLPRKYNSSDAHATNCPAVSYNGDICQETCKAGYTGEAANLTCIVSGLQGTFTGDSATCVPCPLNTYFNPRASPKCVPCILGSTTYPASLSKVDCHCFPGAYEKSPYTAVCYSCPDGAVCAGDHAPPVSAPGYFTSVNTSDGEAIFVKCSSVAACPGNGTCGIGYTDYLCANCMDGYYPLNSECLPCPEGGAWQLYVAVVVVAIVVGVILLIVTKPTPLSERTFGFGSIGVALGFIQIVSTFADLRVPWTTTTRSSFSSFSTLNFNVEIVRPSCIVRTNFYDAFRLQMYIPFFVAAFLLAAFMIGSIVLLVKTKCHVQRQLPRIRNLAETAVSGFLFYLTLAYLNLARTAFSIFACTQRADNSITLNDSPSVTCYDAVWSSNIGIAVFGIVVYVIGIPILLTVTFAILKWKYGYLVARRSTFSNFYVAKYNERFWWWETAITLRKLFIVLITQFFVSDADGQIVLCCAVFFISGIATLAAKPFHWSRQNFVENVSILGCIVILFCGQVTGANQFTPAAVKAIDGVVITVVILVFIAVAFGFVLEISVTLHVMNLETRLYPKKEARPLVHQDGAESGAVAVLASRHAIITATPAGDLLLRSTNALSPLGTIATGEEITAACLFGSEGVTVGGPTRVAIFHIDTRQLAWESPRFEAPVESLACDRRHLAVGLRNGKVFVLTLNELAAKFNTVAPKKAKRSAATSPPPPSVPPPPRGPPPPNTPPPPREPPPLDDNTDNSAHLDADGVELGVIASSTDVRTAGNPAFDAADTPQSASSKLTLPNVDSASATSPHTTIVLDATRGPVRALAVTAGFVFVASSEGTIKKFSVQTLQCLRTWNISNVTVHCMSVSATALVVGTAAGRAIHIDLVTDHETVLAGHRSKINHVLIHGDYVLTAGDDGQVTCFDLTEGFYRQSLLEEYEPVQGLCVREGIVYWALKHGDIKSQKLFAAWDIGNVEMSMWRHLASQQKCKLPRALFGSDAPHGPGGARAATGATSYTEGAGKDASVYQELAVLLDNVDWRQLPEIDAAQISQTLTKKHTLGDEED